MMFPCKKALAVNNSVCRNEAGPCMAGIKSPAYSSCRFARSEIPGDSTIGSYSPVGDELCDLINEIEKIIFCRCILRFHLQ